MRSAFCIRSKTSFCHVFSSRYTLLAPCGASISSGSPTAYMCFPYLLSTPCAKSASIKELFELSDLKALRYKMKGLESFNMSDTFIVDIAPALHESPLRMATAVNIAEPKVSKLKCSSAVKMTMAKVAGYNVTCRNLKIVLLRLISRLVLRALSRSFLALSRILRS